MTGRRGPAVPPHTYQPAGLVTTPRWDPCAYPGCPVLRDHAVHRPGDPPRDITEPTRKDQP